MIVSRAPPMMMKRETNKRSISFEVNAPIKLLSMKKKERILGETMPRCFALKTVPLVIFWLAWFHPLWYTSRIRQGEGGV